MSKFFFLVVLVVGSACKSGNSPSNSSAVSSDGKGLELGQGGLFHFGTPLKADDLTAWNNPTGEEVAHAPSVMKFLNESLTRSAMFPPVRDGSGDEGLSVLQRVRSSCGESSGNPTACRDLWPEFYGVDEAAAGLSACRAIETQTWAFASLLEADLKSCILRSTLTSKSFAVKRLKGSTSVENLFRATSSGRIIQFDFINRPSVQSLRTLTQASNPTDDQLIPHTIQMKIEPVKPEKPRDYEVLMRSFAIVTPIASEKITYNADSGRYTRTSIEKRKLGVANSPQSLSEDNSKYEITAYLKPHSEGYEFDRDRERILKLHSNAPISGWSEDANARIELNYRLSVPPLPLRDGFRGEPRLFRFDQQAGIAIYNQNNSRGFEGALNAMVISRFNGKLAGLNKLSIDQMKTFTYDSSLSVGFNPGGPSDGTTGGIWLLNEFNFEGDRYMAHGKGQLVMQSGDSPSQEFLRIGNPISELFKSCLLSQRCEATIPAVQDVWQRVGVDNVDNIPRVEVPDPRADYQLSSPMWSDSEVSEIFEIDLSDRSLERAIKNCGEAVDFMPKRFFCEDYQKPDINSPNPDFSIGAAQVLIRKSGAGGGGEGGELE